MTIRDLFDSGIIIQGWIRIQRWDDDTVPTIFVDGIDQDISEEIMDEEITYMFPISPQPHVSGICIEIREDSY